MEFVKPAFEVLQKFYKNPEKNLKLILSKELNKINDFQRHQVITRTVYEVVRNDHLLTYLIQKISKRKLKKIQPRVLILLKIGICLLILSKSYPDYAVVDEVVKAAGINAKGFVNALLRNIAANKESIRQNLEKMDRWDLYYSVPKIVMSNLELISPRLRENLDYLNQDPRFHIRVNWRKSSYNEMKQLLEDHQITFKELEKFQSFEIKESSVAINLLLTQRHFYFQNTGSQIISIIASQFAQKKVLDSCAAPGTKSVTLSLLNPQLMIYANDINAKRVKLMKKFLDQYNLNRIKPLVSNIKHIRIKKNFDFIILDAPCTSSGTLRKNPDLKIKINKESINRNAKHQYQLIKSIFSGLSGPVYILYSVCSFIKEETEKIIEKLIEKPSLADRLEIIDLTKILEEYEFDFKKSRHGYYLLPNATLNNDLFYICLLKFL